jgi:SAM-dependent methyltransferase
MKDGSSMNSEDFQEINEHAWDIVARTKYAHDVEEDVAFLSAGGTSLISHERRLLGNLSSWCERAIHLQCSHGLDALSLWKLGAREIVGVDISAEMLGLAQRKSEMMGAPATWIHSAVLEVPANLNATADLVYTGKGAVPWVMDLERWAAVIVRLLKPGGRLYIFEGHPLNWVWEPQASEFRLRADGGDYFSRELRDNRDFPASGLQQAAGSGGPASRAIERQWTLGEIVTRLTEAGLTLERLEEHPEQYWPLFREIPEEAVARLPHTFSLCMRKHG